MSMGRYLCQLCYSIVQYGERHPCFYYKNDDEVYTVPLPNEPDDMEREDVEPKEIHTFSLKDSNGNICAAVQRKCIEGSQETGSLLYENYGQISLMPASRRKRSCPSLMPSKFLRGRKNGPSGSKTASSTHAERDRSKDATKKSKNRRKTESTSSVVLRVGNGSSSEMAPNSAAFGPVSDAAAASEAGPSGIQTQPHKTTKEKLFVCDVCEKYFARNYHLQEHKKTHTGDKPFVCNTCDKRFTKQINLTRHFRTHTGEKPFDCDICGKGFAQKVSLESHVRTHTGEKPFKCEFCDECFSRQSNCNRHQSRKHGGM